MAIRGLARPDEQKCQWSHNYGKARCRRGQPVLVDFSSEHSQTLTDTLWPPVPCLPSSTRARMNGNRSRGSEGYVFLISIVVESMTTKEYRAWSHW